MKRGNTFSRDINKRAVIGCMLVMACVAALLFSSYYSIVKADTVDWVDNNFTSIATGENHTCGILSGVVYCWGSGANGSLGNNSTTSSLVPVPVDTSGVLSGKTVTAISAGFSHTCALASGAVYCWGSNSYGELGDNSTTQSLVPVAVDTSGVLSGKTVTAISAGGYHNCVVASDAAYCWGRNGNGQLGDNSTIQSLVPVAVDVTSKSKGTFNSSIVGLAVTQIDGGDFHTCVIANSTVHCWGNNGSGRLGNNSVVQSNFPVAVDTSGVLSGKTVTAISAGGYHNCVVASDAAYCWGSGSSGQLGSNSTAQSLVPVTVDTSGVLSGKTATAISVGSGHSCAIAGGIAACWGFNLRGQLGDNSTTQSLVPVAVDTSGILSGKTVTAIASGGSHSCAIAGSIAACWGFNIYGQIGNNSTTQSLIPVVLKSVAFFTHSSYRHFSNPDAIQPGAPLAAVDQPAVLQSAGSAFRVRTGVLNEVALGPAATISSGNSHSCVAASSAAYCWGNNTNGRLGNNTTVHSLVPVAVDTRGVLSGKQVTDVAAGAIHSCAVASGAAYCWGFNINGRLGNNSSTESLVPVAVDTSGVLSGKTVTAIATGNDYSCAVASGAAYCWGSNNAGQLGNNSTAQSLVPVAVDTSGVLSGKTVTAIATGNAHTCAVASGAAYCWGSGTGGRLGNNATGVSLVPVAVDTSGVLSGKTVTAISAGSSHTCAVASGAAYCWGSNGTNGVLGNNSTAESLVPVAVDTSGVLSGKTVTDVAASSVHTCAVASDAPYCWGSGASGRMGHNSTTGSLIPVATTTSGVLSGKTVTDISAGSGSSHTCTVANNAAYCWGSGASGQLGNESTTQSIVPVAVIDVLSALIQAASAELKLQYAQKTAATCSQQTTGFADVSTTSAIAWQTNPSVANGVAISSNVNDPTDPIDTVYQSYVSGGTSFKNTIAIPVNKFSLWDFSLKDNSGLANTTYCMKIVYASNADFEIYKIHPEITTAPASFSLGFVDNAGSPVSNPAFAMTTTSLLSSCQTVTGQIGSMSGSRLRLSQGSAGSGWNISIAATGGSTSSWARTDNGAYYDFNDSSGSPAGCNSGSDGDGLAGQLSVAANSLTVTPQSGCSTTGLSLGGGMTGFSQGAIDAITLITSTSGSQSNCYWDLSDMAISQKIPSSQAQGSYELQLTMTVVAQ